MLRCSVLASTTWADELKDSWKELLESSPTATPFQTWEWQSLWWKYYGSAKKPYLLQVREGEDLVGLMPLMVSTGLWRTLRSMATGSSDYLHPLARQGFEAAVSEAVANQIAEFEGVDLIDLHQIRENLPLAHEAGKYRQLDQSMCLVLDLPPTYDEFLAMLGKSLRYDVKKLDKTVFSSGQVRIEPVSPDDVQHGLDVFFDTHKKRWRKRGLPGAFVGTRSVRFHREWAEVAATNGWLKLNLLHWKGNPVGSIYAMQLGDTCYYYQAGFDPSAASISPGTLLVANTIRDSINCGLSKFDFLRGDEPYKRRWKPQHAYRNLRFLAPAKGVLGRMGQAWNDAGNRVESRVRARLEGRGLF